MSAAVLWLLACAASLTGTVLDGEGAPVPGAVVDAGGCSAVTDASGHFSVSCEPSTWHFRVTHPAFQDGAMSVEAGRGDVTVPTVTLRPIPTAPGLYAGPALEPLPSVGLEKVQGDKTMAFCLPPDAVLGTLPAGEQQLLDIHAVDWRLLRADGEGCFYRLSTKTGAFWSWTADEVKPLSKEVTGEGRERVTVALTPGRYVFAEWYEGFFVGEGGRFRALGVSVP